MLHLRFCASMTLAQVVLSGSLLFADTPVRPMQASFPSKPAQAKAPLTQPMTVSEAEKLLQMSGEKPALAEPKAAIDYSIKAASIEVAWLQDTATYPFHLRAESKPGEETITLTGYVPSEKLREKAVFVARMTVGNLNIVDQLTVQPQMVLPGDVPVDQQQTQLVQEYIEKAVPGISKMLQITVDAAGVTTVCGRVDEFADRLKIIRSLQGIPGCTAIRYDLRVCVPAVSSPAAQVQPPAQSVTQASVNVPVPVVTLPTPPTATEVKTPPAPPMIKLPDPPVQVSKVVATKEPVKQITPVAAKSSAGVPASSTASAIVLAGCIEPAHHNIEKVSASSLSGLFPPGMSGRSTEPGIILGSPIIVKASFDINLDVGLTPVDTRTETPKAADIGKSSTTSSVQEQAPIPIGIMPRLAK